MKLLTDFSRSTEIRFKTTIFIPLSNNECMYFEHLFTVLLGELYRLHMFPLQLFGWIFPRSFSVRVSFLYASRNRDRN